MFCGKGTGGKWGGGGPACLWGKTSGRAKRYGRGRVRIPYYIFLRKLAALKHAPKNGDSYPPPPISLSSSLNIFPHRHAGPPPPHFPPALVLAELDRMCFGDEDGVLDDFFGCWYEWFLWTVFFGYWSKWFLWTVFFRCCSKWSLIDGFPWRFSMEVFLNAFYR